MILFIWGTLNSQIYRNKMGMVVAWGCGEGGWELVFNRYWGLVGEDEKFWSTCMMVMAA